MFDVRRAFRNGALVVAAITMPFFATPSRADTGTVHIVVTKAGFIVGVGGGRGVLTFHGHRYPLSIGGLSVGFAAGASRNEVVGRALNMTQPSDIAGTYTAIGAGVAVAGGGGAARLQNGKGVVLELRGRKVGFEAGANLSGVEISLR
jgi:hypothetical protein